MDKQPDIHTENLENESPSSSQNQTGSSPIVPSSRGSNKLRKPPPITPRRFNRFFNPRSSASTSGRSGRHLRDITSNGSNRSAVPVCGLHFDDIEKSPNKRRRVAPGTLTPRIESFDSSPLRSSPCAQSPITRSTVARIAPIHRSRTRNFEFRDARHETAAFYSSAADCYRFSTGSVPFCTATCNTNSLVAIGDEEGSIHILESANDSKPSFDKAFLTFKAHTNAVMDLAFSSNDSILATACGDQTSRIIDMKTQQTTCILAEHTSSVKQVAFQPGNDSIVATCGRDGSVAVWDLRCQGLSGRVHGQVQIRIDGIVSEEASATPSFGHRSNLIPSAHPQHSQHQNSGPAASITALKFLPADRSHLLLTASEASCVIKLWDIRGKYTSHRRSTTRSHTATRSIPVSSTAPLESHDRYRHFGITSLSLSTDAARLYAVCRDSTIYAYSANHLILGSASELNANSSTPRYSCSASKSSDEKQGSGPLFGLRHHRLYASSFYIRSALRQATAEHGELLVVGSSDHCPVLFPTCERMLVRSSGAAAESVPAYLDSVRQGHCRPRRPQLSRSLSTSSFSHHARLVDTIPIYTAGTALVRGHEAEVTGLAWTTGGELISVGDDRAARCWRDGGSSGGPDEGQARDLRLGGEGQGLRWGCGWAEDQTVQDWDEEDG